MSCCPPLISVSVEVILVPMDCGPLRNPDNGRVDTRNGTLTGSSATYTCDAGYELSGGNPSRMCGRDGVWSGSQPECTGETVTAAIDQLHGVQLPILLSTMSRTLSTAIQARWVPLRNSV